MVETCLAPLSSQSSDSQGSFTYCVIEVLILTDLQLHFLEQKNTKEVEVMVLPADISSEIEGIERSLEQYCPNTDCGAGFNEDGTFQPCKAGSMCLNQAMGGTEDYPSFYCSQEHHQRLRLKKRTLEYREPMLEFYWNSKGQSDFQEYLRECGLVTQYR